MTRGATYRGALRRLARDESGATLVEFAIVLVVFLILVFGLLDFGRLAFHYVTAEKAMHIAARVAVVRPAVCDTVLPQSNNRDPASIGSDAPDYGTPCNLGGVCMAVAPVSCSGDVANATGQATVSQIWSVVGNTLPNDARPANLLFRYEYDANLGFLGGPYIPIVTVEIQNLNFRFISPFGALFALAGASAPGWLDDNPPSIQFPALSVSLPGEDLAHGAQG